MTTPKELDAETAQRLEIARMNRLSLVADWNRPAKTAVRVVSCRVALWFLYVVVLFRLSRRGNTFARVLYLKTCVIPIIPAVVRVQHKRKMHVGTRTSRDMVEASLVIIKVTHGL